MTGRHPARCGTTSWWWIGAIAAALVLAHVACLGSYGYFRDELYYLACGRRLAWGYVDHPPLVAVMARVTEHLFGTSVAGLRIIPVLLAAALVFVTAAIARRLGGGAFAQVVAALAVAVVPSYLFIFHILSMNSAEIVLWAAAMWLLIVALDTRHRWPWVALGLVFGAGLLNKHSMAFLGGALAFGLLLTPARRALRTPGPWAAAAIAAVMFAPHLAWQARHGWPTLEFARNAQDFKIADLSATEFIGEQFLLVHPLNAPLWLAGLGLFLMRPPRKEWRLFGWAFLALLGLFLLQAAKPYYLTPFYPVLLAGGALTLEAATAGRRSLRAACMALLIAGGAALAPVALPILPVQSQIAYLQWLGIAPSSGERHEPGVLPQHLADMFGWEELAHQISGVYQSLPEEEKASARVFARNYGQAGALELFRDRYALPPVISPHNNYWLWGPGRDGGTLIIIGGSPEDNLQAFEQLEEVTRSHCELCMPYEHNLPIYIGRGWKVSLNAIWPGEKRYI
jgi:hypothetical protein